MDTDDLSDEAYAIIIAARDVSGLLGAQLAVAGARAKTEMEFLREMSLLLREVAGDARDSWDAYDGVTSGAALRRLCRDLQSRIAETWPNV